MLLWHKDHSKPVLKFDLGAYVGDIAWAPYSRSPGHGVSMDLVS
jgi:hypothetical protein